MYSRKSSKATMLAIEKVMKLERLTLIISDDKRTIEAKFVACLLIQLLASETETYGK